LVFQCSISFCLWLLKEKKYEEKWFSFINQMAFVAADICCS